MKPTELQIGDYVFIKSLLGGYHTIPIRIAAIHQKKVGYHNRIDRLSWVRHGMIAPIPLTKEILELNNFQVSSEDERIYELYLANDIVVCVCIEAPHFISINYEVETPDGKDGDNISAFTKVDGGEIYFHDLQNHLRHSGLDMLADELKVE